METKIYNNLQEIISEHGMENLRFLVPMRPLKKMLFFTYTSSSDKEQMVLCKIVEERYKLSENYKIELRAENEEHFGKETFYIRDLQSLIDMKQIRMFIEITSED